MIHIDRVSADVEVFRSPATGDGRDGPSGSTSGAASGISTDLLRHMVMEILREHLRELERRGVL